MKKIISIMFAMLLALSVSITAFAAEDTATPDSADLELQIKQDANEYFYDGNANVDDINVVRYGTLSDGSPVVNIYRYGGAATVTFSYIIGNYEYHCHAGDEAYIYKDNNFYFIVDAYESGLINDDTLDELYNCSVEYLKNPLESSYFLMYPLEIETTTQSVENTTQPTETTTPDSADFELQIKQDANEDLYNGSEDIDNLCVTYYGTLNDGSLVLNVSPYGGYIQVSFSHVLGNYNYTYGPGEEAYIYKDNNFYFIVDAYESGLINDDTLDELYNCSVEYLKAPVNARYFIMYPLEIETTTQSVENTTQPTETTTPDATSSTDAPEADPTTAIVETKPASTSDTATANNSNNAVQTGQSSFAIMTTLLVIALSGAVVVFTKYGYNK